MGQTMGFGLQSIALCCCGAMACSTADNPRAPSAPESRTEDEQAAMPATDPAPTTGTRDAQPEPDEMRAIPAGKLLLGSAPGGAGRRASLEADLLPVNVSAFEIDRLPYPNDPRKSRKTGLTQAQAAAACGADGKRLCHEFEWERACKGNGERPFATGASMDVAACRKDPARCQSPFGVAGLGTTPEWTASLVPRDGKTTPLRAIVRGGGAAQGGHRCGARRPRDPTSVSADQTFRCCKSSGQPPPVDSYPVEPRRPIMRPLKLDGRRVREILASIEPVSALAQDFVPFGRRDVDAALRRGKRSRSNITAWHFAPSAFEWSPARGEAIWIITGEGQGNAALVALFPTADGSFRHGVSAVLDGRDATIAVGYTEDKPDHLLWTTCFGCPGESGDLRYSTDEGLQNTFR